MNKLTFDKFEELNDNELYIYFMESGAYYDQSQSDFNLEVYESEEIPNLIYYEEQLNIHGPDIPVMLRIARALACGLDVSEETGEAGDSQESKVGAKYDQDKPRTHLVLSGFSKALLEVSKVGTFGANKYTDNGWKEVPKGIERYSSAMLRHYFSEQVEYLDPETNLSHAAAVAWNALARLQLILSERDRDEEKQQNTETN